ncbi:hypothetical protein MJT46_009047 [Ovis ammon polii x Ovis aries]|nr:hypothetical protein MJT46_009047 [Ovis ammon polii x Ovis aries]
MYHERNLRDDRYKRQILVYKDHKEEGRDAHTLPCGSEEGLLCEETYGPVFKDAIVFPEKGPGSTATVQFKRHAELQQASGISHADVLSTFHLLISMDSQCIAELSGETSSESVKPTYYSETDDSPQGSSDTDAPRKTIRMALRLSVAYFSYRSSASKAGPLSTMPSERRKRTRRKRAINLENNLFQWIRSDI